MATLEFRRKKEALDGKFHGRRPVGRPRRRWEDNNRRRLLVLLNVRGWRRIAGDRELLRRAGPVADCGAADEE